MPLPPLEDTCSNTVAMLTHFCSISFQVQASSNSTCCVLQHFRKALSVYNNNNATNSVNLPWPGG